MLYDSKLCLNEDWENERTGSRSCAIQCNIRNSLLLTESRNRKVWDGPGGTWATFHTLPSPFKYFSCSILNSGRACCRIRSLKLRVLFYLKIYVHYQTTGSRFLLSKPVAVSKSYVIVIMTTNADPISCALRNELILQNIFKFLPLESLMTVSRINKFWNHEARTYLRDHRTCTVYIKSWEVEPCLQVQ